MLRSIANIWDLALGVAEDNDERSFKAAFHQDTAVGVVYKEFIDDESSRTSSSRRRRIARYRDRNWGKVFTLSVIKAPKVDFYGRAPRMTTRRIGTLGWSTRTSCRHR